MHSKIYNLYSNNAPIRYDFAVESAYDFIIEQGINSLPVDPFNICINNNWRLEKASNLANYLGCSTTYLMHSKLKTTDGIVIYSPSTNEYSIIYNDQVNKKERIRWTIAHEIGHIVLGHLSASNTSLFRNELPDLQYAHYEKEADCFAGILLAPPIILKKMNIFKNYQIQMICDLSYQASDSRSKYIENLYDFNKFDDYSECLLEQFKNFINEKNCSTCGSRFHIEHLNYCPICGSKNLFRNYIKGDAYMIYDSIELNDRNKAKICPVCKNEITDIDGGFCQICGTYISNECTNPACESDLPGDARFCPHCGSPSTFKENKLLKAFNDQTYDFNDLFGAINPEEIISNLTTPDYSNTNDDMPF